ncbi:uncharacterized protein LOC128201317 [Galleria mellonella]|uniref:Uncharacterized protein LOC128201317 n=1 Tax=Galleria mellonella TaxID=7137 RepID=A0ABM3MRF1_GALME|nr:uncharacterized protein LOC128201317 [Galleria mellonella]
MHQNIAGILNKQEIFQITLDELKTNGTSVEVICLSETFLKSNDEKNLHIQGYCLADFYSRPNQRRGGVCILCKDHYSFNKISMLSEYATERTFECCGISIPQMKFFIICIYRIPKSDPQLFLNKLETLLDKLRYKKNYKIIIAGDFNINILKDSNIQTDYIRIIQNYGFTIHINEPTRQHACLDQIISNVFNVIGHTHKVGLSDHETCQTIHVPILKEQKPKKMWFKFKRDHNEDNMNKFVQCLSDFSWMEVFEATKLNDAFNFFYENLILFYKLCFPMCKIKITSKSKNSEWITKGLRKSCVTKRKLRFKYYKKKNQESRTQYRKYAESLKQCIYVAQKLNNKKYLTKAKNINKATWNLINKQDQLYRRDKYIHRLYHDNKIITNCNDICNIFNDFYINIVKKIHNDKIKPTKLTQINYQKNSMFLSPTTCDEIYKIIISLNNTESVRYDEFPTKLLKTCAHIISPILSYLINLSFIEGTFPDLLKISVIKPIYKKYDKQLVDNYRPISLIPIIAKVFEKAIYTRIVAFLDKFKILKDDQHGFRKGKSISLAAFKLIKTITENIDKNIDTVAVFFDMSKAFDCAG